MRRRRTKNNNCNHWCRLMLIASLMASPVGLNSTTIVEMGTTKEYYCEFCGHRFPDVRLLVSAFCSRHPSGPNKGKHKLYEGATKSKYTCKYCGRQFPSIMLMTGGTCANHPNGSNKGKHAPSL